MIFSFSLLPKHKYFAAMALALFVAALPLQAQETLEEEEIQESKTFFKSLDWFIRGTLLITPENNGNASAPSPIPGSLGGGASYAISDRLAAEISLDIYFSTYDYDVRLDRAIPANDEFRSAMSLSFLLGFQPVFRFRPKGDKFTIRAYGGLSFDLRLVLPASGLSDGEGHSNNGVPDTGLTIGQARSKINSYLWGNGRYIFPHIGGGMDFPILEDIQLGFDVRIWIPIWRAWSGESLSGLHGFRFGIGFRLTF